MVLEVFKTTSFWLLWTYSAVKAFSSVKRVLASWSAATWHFSYRLLSSRTLLFASVRYYSLHNLYRVNWKFFFDIKRTVSRLFCNSTRRNSLIPLKSFSDNVAKPTGSGSSISSFPWSSDCQCSLKYHYYRTSSLLQPWRLTIPRTAFAWP